MFFSYPYFSSFATTLLPNPSSSVPLITLLVSTPYISVLLFLSLILIPFPYSPLSLLLPSSSSSFPLFAPFPAPYFILLLPFPDSFPYFTPPFHLLLHGSFPSLPYCPFHYSSPSYIAFLLPHFFLCPSYSHYASYTILDLTIRIYLLFISFRFHTPILPLLLRFPYSVYHLLLRPHFLTLAYTFNIPFFPYSSFFLSYPSQFYLL